MKLQTGLLMTAGNLFNTMDAALNDENAATVQYSLNKRPKDMWNFVLGSQYQINKHFMLRAEGWLPWQPHAVHWRSPIPVWLIIG